MSAIIIGGTGGIGRAVCEKFKLIMPVISTGKKDVDITNINSLLNFYAEKKSVKAQIIVCMSGGPIEGRGALGDTPFRLAASIDYNLIGPIYVAKYLAPLLFGVDGGMLVFVSSINAIRSYGYPAYSAAKAGLSGLTISLAKSMGRMGVRVNSVMCGTTKTETKPRDSEEYRSTERKLPLERFARAEDVADAIYGLWTMRAVTGQTLIVDGGQSITP